MIKKTTYIESTGVNPHKNLAMEEYLFSRCGEDEAILYLWQNENTIVIGKNQNAWKECQISKIEEDGAVIARRISGGGAVFHDLGNLNFTFLVSKENYNLKRQLEVILSQQQVRLGSCPALMLGLAETTPLAAEEVSVTGKGKLCGRLQDFIGPAVKVILGHLEGGYILASWLIHGHCHGINIVNGIE